MTDVELKTAIFTGDCDAIQRYFDVRADPIEFDSAFSGLLKEAIARGHFDSVRWFILEAAEKFPERFKQKRVTDFVDELFKFSADQGKLKETEWFVFDSRQPVYPSSVKHVREYLEMKDFTAQKLELPETSRSKTLPFIRNIELLFEVGLSLQEIRDLGREGLSMKHNTLTRKI